MRAENTAAYAFAFRLIAVVAVSVLLTGAMALHLYGIIHSSLGNIQATLQGVSESLDLTQRAPVERSDEIGRTAVASEEQRHGTEQVNQAITQMDAVTQQNAALV